MPIIRVDFGGGQGWRYYNNQRNPKRLSCCCCCCCMSNCRVSSLTVMSFAVTRFFEIAREPGMWSLISGPMWSKQGIINIKSAALSSCVCPVSVPRGWDSRLFPKIGLEGFFLESCCKYGLHTLEGIQRIGFKKKGRGSGKMKLIRSRSTVTAVLVHSNMVICGGTDGYPIR